MCSNITVPLLADSSRLFHPFTSVLCAGDGSARPELAQQRVAALATAVAALGLVPREQAYLLGKEWWPRCPAPSSVVTVEDMRGVLAAGTAVTA